MSSFKIVNSRSEITLSSQWTSSAKFNSKNRIVDENGKAVSSEYKGRRYQIVEKRERIFSVPERIGRGFLGTLVVVCTLFLALFSESVRNLFVKSKETVHFAVLVPSTPGPQLPKIDPYPELTQAREELITWLKIQGNMWGKGDEFKALTGKVDALSKDLPKNKIIFHSNCFRFGFNLYYVEIPGQQKYMPIKRQDGMNLYASLAQPPKFSWPLIDPKNNSYFIPEITWKDVSNSHTGSETTGSYLFKLFGEAEKNKESSAYRILEGLTGYAEWIQREFDDSRYQALRQLIPSYPDLPALNK